MTAKQKNLKTDYVNHSAVLWENNFFHESKELKGGRLSAYAGSCRVILTDADIAGDSLTINVSAFWGYIELIVPTTWNVSMKCSPILGYTGLKVDSPPSGVERKKTLIIQGTVIMGGLEIKSS